MLPIPVLDDEGFREIAESARRMIPLFYPAWTDFNHHDPGITFLELFAFLKESQQYHMDQIGPRSREKYWRLLGVERAHRAAATAWAAVSCPGRAASLPRGTRLLAGDIPFELTRTARLSGGRLRRGFAWDGTRKIRFSTGVYAQTGKLRIEAFGRTPGPDSACYLCFDAPPFSAGPLRLYLRVGQEWPVRRNPVAMDGFHPLVRLEWEYRAQEGWERLEVLEDGTLGLLFSGEIALKRPAAPAPVSGAEEGPGPLEGEDGGHWVRVRLSGGEYDVPPVLTGLSDELFPVVQRETAAEWARLPVHPQEDGSGLLWDDGLLSAAGEFQVMLPAGEGGWRTLDGAVRKTRAEDGRTLFHLPPPAGQAKEALLLTWRPSFAPERRLPEGNGFPNQTRQLPQEGLLFHSVQLLAAQADDPGLWTLWEKVADFDASGPEDRHYVLDEETGLLRFGDCHRGLAPEGGLLIAGLSVSLGPGGNVKAGKLRRLHPEDGALLGLEEAQLRITNPDNAAGGREREREEDCLLRCREALRRSRRAVTYGDYEKLTLKTPGLMISNCKAVPVTRLPRQDGSLAENCVTLVVEPFSLGESRTLSPAYEANILDYLETWRMLGTKVAVLPPEYICITVYAEILSQPHYVDAKARIQAAVEEFFQKGWEFGSPVRYSALYGSIDTLDCVAGVESLTIDAQGKGISRSISGDVLLPYNGLAVLRGASCQVRPAE